MEHEQEPIMVLIGTTPQTNSPATAIDWSISMPLYLPDSTPMNLLNLVFIDPISRGGTLTPDQTSTQFCLVDECVLTASRSVCDVL